MSDYEAEYREKLEESWVFQDFVCERLHMEGIVLQPIQSQSKQLTGENLLGLEIKHDHRFRETGNLYIETHEKSHPANRDYVKSGILRADNSWLFGIGDYQRFFVFATSTLRLISGRKDLPWRKTTTTDTSRGILLPVEQAEIYAARIFDW